MDTLSEPFDSAASDLDADWVARAQAGELAALDLLLRRHQPWIFNLALRMVWRREAAEDATQEILIKATTRLSSFEGRSKFSTWLYRIAVNHLLNVRKSEMEERRMGFGDMGRSLDDCPDADLPDPQAEPAHRAAIVEEAKLGCITAMLMCLDRRQRLAFILGEVFGVRSELGGEVMEISSENFRQLLARARRDLYQFMQGKCGLANPLNPCRCSKKAAAFMERGWLDPQRRQFTADRLASVAEVAPSRLEELQEIDRAHATLYRDTPLVAPPDVAGQLRAIVERSGFGADRD